MQVNHKKRDGFISCVDTVSSKDDCIKFQVQMFEYDDPKMGPTICVNVIEANWDTTEGLSHKITPATGLFSGELAYETDFPASEREKAEQCFKSLCDEFDPDKNKDLEDPNGNPDDLIE